MAVIGRSMLSGFVQTHGPIDPYHPGMPNAALSDFIDAHRDELIGTCRARVLARSSPPPSDAEIEHGVPLLLSQLSTQLRRSAPSTHEISETARKHGYDLLVRGFTIDQVVRDYGDVCQALTELAVEAGTAITAEDFRTLNQCLDDAIAGAVTEFTKAQTIHRNGELAELWNLVNSAGVAFEALQSGRVGMGGATAGIVRQSLAALRAYVGRHEVKAAPETGGSPVPPAPGRGHRDRSST